MPRFSIIVPIYNIEDYLDECLASLAAQKFDDFEVLCVIDGSKDGSLQIARTWAAHDERFKVLEKENGGLSSARNFGIDHAQGDVLLFVDGDDLVDPELCGTLDHVFGETEADAVIFGATTIPQETGNEWFDLALSPPKGHWPEFGPQLMFAIWSTPFVWRNAVKRKALEQAEVRFNEQLPFGEDVIFQFGLYPRIGAISTIPDKLYIYRVIREGSLMDGQKTDLERLSDHVPMVASILQDWKAQDLLEQNCEQLFEWSEPFLTRDLQNLEPQQRACHMQKVNDLWAMLPIIPKRPAKIRCTCLCRGEGKVYASYKIGAAFPFSDLICQADLNGSPIPIGAYPLHNQPGEFEQEWVLEIPIVETRALEITIMPDGRLFEAAKITMNYRGAKWASRINYRLRSGQCARIRDIERNFMEQAYRCRILQRFNASNGAIWRCCIEWIGDAAWMPRIQTLSGTGQPLETTWDFCELQKGNAAELRPNALIISLHTASDLDWFVLTASKSEVSDPIMPLQNGFAVVDAERSQDMKLETEDLMTSAATQPRAYGRWLAEQRKYAKALSVSEGSSSMRKPNEAPRFSIIICSDDAKSDALAITRSSLEAQSFDNWEAIEVKDAAFQHALQQANGEYVAIISAGDTLEPNAFCVFDEYIQRAESEQRKIAVLFSDEDCRQPDGTFAQPAFKSKLNIGLQYCYNWIGQLAVFKRSMALRTAVENITTPEGWRYALALDAFASEAGFLHVPYLLYHATVPAAPYRNDAGDASSKELPSILHGHLQSQGINAQVGQMNSPHLLDVRYDLPCPPPLVSIIIPSKDHVDLLEPCLRSLEQKASYSNFEIVVVENNSVEPATFEFYNAIQSEYDNITVVVWSGPFNYSGIINYGVAHSSGDYLLLLNNDTEVIEPAFMEEMLGLLQRPEIGVVGAKLLFRDGLVQHAGVSAGPFDAVVHVNQFLTAQNGGYLGRALLPGNFIAVTGACQMIERDLFEKLEGYDEVFAVGFNDIDFCLRAQREGYETVLAPRALLYHYEFASRGREEADPEQQARWENERMLFKERWPEPFTCGDPFTGPVLMKDNTYYRLD